MVTGIRAFFPGVRFSFAIIVIENGESEWAVVSLVLAKVIGLFFRFAVVVLVPFAASAGSSSGLFPSARHINFQTTSRNWPRSSDRAGPMSEYLLRTTEPLKKELTRHGKRVHSRGERRLERYK